MGKNRLEAFSDGVIAIITTIMFFVNGAVILDQGGSTWIITVKIKG